MTGIHRAKLLVHGGPFDGCGVSLHAGVTTLGRESKNDIVVEHSSVSRRHAKIQSDDKGYWVHDLGSRNGTFVNAQKVETEARFLNDGDKIQLGSPATGTVWEFKVEEGSEMSFSEVEPTAAIPLDEVLTYQKPPCEAFQKNLNGSWTCKMFISVTIPPVQLELSKGTGFAQGVKIMCVDVASWLDEHCE